MNAVALGAAFAGGLAAGRIGVMVADRFAPPRTAPRRIPLQELATAAVTTAVVARFDAGWTVVPPLVAAVSLATLSAVDLRAYRLPDAITFSALGLSLAAIALESAVSGRPGALAVAAATAVGYGAVLWIAHRVRPGGLGLGDVKIGPLLGIHLGWAAAAFAPGWVAPVALAAQALLMSCLIGVAMALVLTLLRRRGFDPLPHPDQGPPPDHPDHPERPRGRASGRANPLHTGEAVARAARERSEQERDTPRPDAMSPHLPAHGLKDTALPFGPALAAGTMIAVLFADLFVG